ncbi:hypothetical protein [Pseudonocardia sp. TRM90224]|uniref:hypothetical protein n=1 Tax=Pseudonocardia sp. TRM90224 TaxID=2812678 RepID=UPI001E438527|nr:hypothetical protein [Pseudonocardia sp. TRM90224]
MGSTGAAVDAQVGERWAYRARGIDPLVEVEVVRHGSKTPARVLVRWIAAEDEGREEWVPPARLKVAWSDRVEFIAREQRWAAVRAVADLDNTTVDWALGEVFDNLPDWSYARPYRNHGLVGVLEIADLEAMLADLDLEQTVVEHPLSFVDDGMLVVPWPVTEVVARRLAETYAHRLLPILDGLDAEADRHNRWGYMSGDHHMPADICAETDAEFRPGRDMARDWCGQPARDRHDELVALREEVIRLGLLVESAVTALRAAGADKPAGRIERELGVPIADIRAQRAAHPR